MAGGGEPAILAMSRPRVRGSKVAAMAKIVDAQIRFDQIRAQRADPGRPAPGGPFLRALAAGTVAAASEQSAAPRPSCEPLSGSVPGGTPAGMARGAPRYATTRVYALGDLISRFRNPDFAMAMVKLRDSGTELPSLAVMAGSAETDSAEPVQVGRTIFIGEAAFGAWEDGAASADFEAALCALTARGLARGH